MKFKIEIDPNRVYDSMEKARNFLNNANILSNYSNPKITIYIEEDN